MNATQSLDEAHRDATREETMSAQFAGLVMQQTNLALMLLGKSPHPETQKTMLDIDGARMFIDQLEMLESKTKGNLDKREQGLLKQSLTALRMAFVEAANQESAPAAKKEPAGSAAAAPSGAAAPEGATSAGVEPAGTTEDAESRKKFSKKY